MPPELTSAIPEPLASHRGAVEDLCRRYHVARLALFGSAARGQAREGSDLDLLVLFHEGHTPGMAFFTFQEELHDVLGRPVDLNTPEDLSRFFRDQVLREAQVVYET